MTNGDLAWIASYISAIPNDVLRVLRDLYEQRDTPARYKPSFVAARSFRMGSLLPRLRVTP